MVSIWNATLGCNGLKWNPSKIFHSNMFFFKKDKLKITQLYCLHLIRLTFFGKYFDISFKKDKRTRGTLPIYDLRALIFFLIF